MQLGLQLDVAMGLNVTAHICAASGNWPTAATLLARSRLAYDEAMYEQHPFDRDADEALLDQARAALGEPALANALEIGRTLELVTAVELADDMLQHVATGNRLTGQKRDGIVS